MDSTVSPIMSISLSLVFLTGWSSSRSFSADHSSGLLKISILNLSNASKLYLVILSFYASSFSSHKQNTFRRIPDTQTAKARQTVLTKKSLSPDSGNL